jgi:hypothetical protein
MQVDLGSVQPITRVKLDWEAAFGSAYQIQTSTNGTTWTDAYTEPAGDGGTDDLKVAANARYVRLTGTQRATGYGYSLFEFSVYGACPGGGGPTTPPPGDPTTPPPGDPTTPPPGGGPTSRDAYSTIQAESYNDQGGLAVQTATDSGGGQNLTNAGNGDWVVYRGVDFATSAAHQFVARAASGAAGGVSGLVEVRLDSRTSAPIGSFAIANTGGWQSWKTIPANISAVTGTHDVYVTFTSGQPADFVNLNWVSFGH